MADAPGNKMAAAVREYVSRMVAGFVRREELEARLKEIPAGPQGQRGESGAKGEGGPKGDKGDAGSIGPVGERGEKGEPGERGGRGETGKDGKDGRDGRDGKDGAAGRDAAEINPLPSIDESRSYPAGTWARHANGLWLSRTATSGMEGWDCIVEGVAAVVVTQGDDLRSIAVAAMLSGGTIAKSEFSMPVMIDRGVWKDGAYERGDVVTWGGSIWIAQKEKPEGKPDDGNGSWRLAVKKGRDGKDK